jgi:hypothetical protein
MESSGMGWRLVLALAAACLFLEALRLVSAVGGVGVADGLLDRGALRAADAQLLAALPSGVLHYAPNGNFDDTGAFLPASAGFDVADMGDPGRLSTLAADVRVLVWVGQCEGVTRKFLDTVQPYLGDHRVFGYYLMDDPDARSHLGAAPPCPPERLREESDWLHEHAPGTKTLIVLMNLSDARRPSYRNSYDPKNSHVDLYGLCAYPCRTEFNGCDGNLISRYVAASDLAGIPRDRLVPIYQAFGGGRWRDDEGGSYIMPSPAEEAQIIRQWRELVPNPVIDMAYSWGTQREDLSLHEAAALKALFWIYNKRVLPRTPAKSP